MRDVYVVSCCRTAVGSFGGSLKDVPATKLGSIVIKEALERAKVQPEWVDETIFGNVLSAGLGQNVARQCALGAGIPNEKPAYSLNMVCGSGMKSIMSAAAAIKAGDAEIIVAGGTENMSASPYALPSSRWGARMGDNKMVDVMIKDGLWDAYNNYHMGTTAENVCEQYNVTREDCDKFALKSQQNAERAIKENRFAEEIVPVTIKVKKEEVEFKVDEYPKAGASMEKLAKLKGAFPLADGTPGNRVTAGNASGINDGAAAFVIASKDAVEKYNLKPMFKIVGYGQAGVDPKIMGVGPINATKNALKNAKLEVKDIDLIEANEAFAAQSVAVARELGLDEDKINVNGGAIAIGHPIGASGARITVTLLYEMLKRDDCKRGLATLCIGGGMGVATIYEKC